MRKLKTFLIRQGKNLLVLFLTLSSTYSGLAQNEYYFTLPEVQKNFRSIRDFHLIIYNNGVEADIRYEWLDITPSGLIVRSRNQISSAGTPSTLIPTNKVVRVRMYHIDRENNRAGCTGTAVPITPLRYHNRLTPDYDADQTGIIRVYSNTPGADFRAYFDLADGSYDDILAIKGISGIANIGDTVLIPGQNKFNTSNLSVIDGVGGSCHPQTRQAVFIGNTSSNPATVEVHTSLAKGIRYNNNNYAANTTFSITIPSKRTVTLYSDGMLGTDNIGGAYFRVTSGSGIVTSFMDAMMSVNNGGVDPGGDALPTTNFLGKHYFLRSGIGTGQEFIMIYPTKDNTTFTVYQGATGTNKVTYTGNLGQAIRHDLAQDIPVFIESDNKLLVYQISGMANEAGASVVPTFGCSGSTGTFLLRPSPKKSWVTTDKLFISLFVNYACRDSFKIYSAPMTNVVGGVYYDESTNWRDITGQLTINWEKQENICANSSEYASALTEIPRQLCGRDSALLVVNRSGVFQMGMLFNNSSATCKFAYLSDYDTMKLDVCLAMKDTFCQYEEPYFNVCSKFKYTHHKIVVKDVVGSVIGQTTVKAYENTKKRFVLREEIPGLPPLGTLGTFKLEHIVYFASELCGESDTCQTDTAKHDFAITTDLDTLDGDAMELKICDWSNSLTPDIATKCAKIGKCNQMGIGYTYIQKIDLSQSLYPIDLEPNYGNPEDSNVLWCLTPGMYFRYCYDTLNCQIIKTQINVVNMDPEVIGESASYTLCNWSGTSYAGDTCVEIGACSGEGIAYTYIETAGISIPGIVPPSSGTSTDSDVKWCLTPGEYKRYCYDTINCIIYQTDILVQMQVPQVIGESAAYTVCDWSGTNYTGSGCAEVGSCNNPGIAYTYIETAGISIPGIVPPSSGTSEDPNVKWCLTPGEYKRYCYDTVNCIIYQTNILVETDTPQVIGESATYTICDWSGTNYTGSDCAEVGSCNNPGIAYTYIETAGISIPGIVPPSSGTSTDPDVKWCLTPGEYKRYCYDTVNCIIYQTNILVEIETPQVIGESSWFTVCYYSDSNYTSSNCALVGSCNNPGIAYTYIETAGISIPGIVPPSSGTSADSNVKWCLTPGEYKRYCYDTVNCQIIQTNITVDQVTATTITSSDTLEYCVGGCLELSCENPDNIAYAYLINLSTPTLHITPISGTTNPHNNAVWCVPDGDYILTCYDSVACEVYKKTIKVIRTPVIIQEEEIVVSICPGESIDLDELHLCPEDSVEWFFPDGNKLASSLISPGRTMTFHGLSPLDSDSCVFCRTTVTVEVEDTILGETYILNVCDTPAQIGRNPYPGTTYTISAHNTVLGTNTSGYFTMPGPSAVGSITYTITYTTPGGCPVEDIYILNCGCPDWDDPPIEETRYIYLSPGEDEFTFDPGNPCPEGCSLQMITVQNGPSDNWQYYKIYSNQSGLRLTSQVSNVKIECYDENGCYCGTWFKYNFVYILVPTPNPGDTTDLGNQGNLSADKNEVSSKFDVNVYPNPTKDGVFVKLRAVPQQFSITVSNATGLQVLKRESLTGLTQFIDLSEQASGIYLITINVNGRLFKEKIVLLK